MTQNSDGHGPNGRSTRVPVQAEPTDSHPGAAEEPTSPGYGQEPPPEPAGPAPQHPSFDEAQGDWGQSQAADPQTHKQTPPWYTHGQSGSYPQANSDDGQQAGYGSGPYPADPYQPSADPYKQPYGPDHPPVPPQPASDTPRPEVVNPFLEQSHTIPQKGVRRAVYRATFGALNLGPTEEERATRERRERVARPLHGAWRVVVMSIKGGVGKTTTTAMTGRTLAEWRGDRVVTLDTNPDMGTLGDRLVGSTDVTVRGLLAHEARTPIQQVAEVNRFTNLAGRLHVLANEQDPAVSEDFSGLEYQRTLNILERFYNIIVADCGTGVLRPWVRDMLALANTLVVVAEPKGDAATRAAGTLDWIAQHGFHDLVARSVAVINYRSPTPKSLDVEALTTFFAERCRAVCKIRYDEHLDLGVQIQYDPIPDAPTEAYVADATKEDYLELAATIADEFR